MRVPPFSSPLPVNTVPWKGTFVMAQRQAQLASARPARMLNKTPLPKASIRGLETIVPTHANILRNRLFIATVDELLPGTASIRYVVVVANEIIIPNPKKNVP